MNRKGEPINCGAADVKRKTFHLTYKDTSVLSESQILHQNVGHLCIRESGRVYEEVHEEGAETEKIPRLLSVPHTERPGGALPAAAAQRYGKRMKGLPLKIVCHC